MNILDSTALLADSFSDDDLMHSITTPPSSSLYDMEAAHAIVHVSPRNTPMDVSMNMKSSYVKKRLPISRKLRKSCSLDACPQKPGECMHCTCDGRCGKHENGKCGLRREGSGKNCKVPNCTRDEKCLHSTRATCCHCRNLVSSQSRGMKMKREQKQAQRKRKTGSLMDGTKTKKCVVSSTIASATKISFLATRRNIEPAVGTTRSLMDVASYRNRLHMANMIVVVEGKQFHLHTFPLLAKSSVLANRYKVAKQKDPHQIVVIRFDTFPGGASGFEICCIYTYAQTFDHWDTNVIAKAYAASHYLHMDIGNVCLSQRSLLCIQDIVEYGTTTEVVSLLNSYLSIPSTLETPLNVIDACIHSISRQYPFDPKDIDALQRLTCESFLQIAHSIVCQHSSTLTSDYIVEICGLSSLAQVFRNENTTMHEKSTLLYSMLQDILCPASTSNSAAKLVLKVLDQVEDEKSLRNSSGRILAQAMRQAYVA